MTREEFNELMSQELMVVGETQITLLSISLFILTLAFMVLVISLNARFFNRVKSRTDENNLASLYILQRFSHYIIIAIGVFVALTTLGVDLTHLALLATALSVGIGFGLQSIFSNFFSGIIVLLERSLKVGDFIELDGGISGTVQEINIRSTLVRTRNNVDVIVPNSEFVNGRVSNWTLGDTFSRFQIPFGVAYGSDKEKVKKAALEAAEKVSMTLYGGQHDPDVWLVNFGDSSLDFQLVVWVDLKKNTRPGGIVAQYLWEIESSLNNYQIQIPFPQRDLHIKSGQLDQQLAS